MSVGVSTIQVASGKTENGPESTAPPSLTDSVRRRLEAMPPWTWQSWAVTLWVAVIAGLLRFVNLGLPPGLVFDEVYYATEGQELLDHGVEWRQLTDSSGAVTHEYGDFVVHPPLGKWMIALGIKMSQSGAFGWMFQNDAAGWRFMAAVCGVISIIVITRVARRLFKSTVLGAAAGLLMAMDGMHFVLSRIAILDIFLMFFIVLAFGCLIMDRDSRRARWLRLMEQGLDPRLPGKAGRPKFGWSSVPWWRLGMGVMLGAGCAVKWSAVWFIPVFLLLALWWEVGARKTIGARHPWRDTLIDETGWAFLSGVLVIVAYLSSWIGWFTTDDGWKRHYLANELGGSDGIGAAFYNLWAYHVDVLKFHEGLTTPHQYQSWPWQWLILGRPIAFYWNGDPRCGAEKCAAEILLVGTPVLWWSFLPALAALIWLGISRRDWRALAIFAGAAAGILPWFIYQFSQRTMFYFYALPAEPFLVLAVVYVLGAMINGPGVGRENRGRVRTVFSLPPEDRRLYGTIFAAAFILLVAVCFWWFYPIYVGNSIPYDDWARRMLLGNRWIS